MPLATLNLNGETLQLTPEGAAFRPACRTLVVADLHFEKGSAIAARTRRLAPPYDTMATLERLKRLMRRLQPKRVVALGDSFHDLNGPNRLSPQALRGICSLTEAVDWIWIEGNHDPLPPKTVGGHGAAEITIGALVLRHIPATGLATGEIAGHLHPKASVQTGVRTISGFCYVTDGHRLLLPAFGAYTGGLDVHDPEIRGRFRKGSRVFLLGRDRLYNFPFSVLSPRVVGLRV